MSEAEGTAEALHSSRKGIVVESRRGAVAWAVRQHPVSSPRSSNRTCGFPASGSPTGFTRKAHGGDGPNRLPTFRRRQHRDRYAPSPCGYSLFAMRSFFPMGSSMVFAGSSPITDPLHLPKHAGSQGPLLHRHYPASTLRTALSDSRLACRACHDVAVATCDRKNGSPPITRITFPTCRAHYPGGPNGCTCRSLPHSCGLPRFSGGSASALSLSRPAQASLALRPAGSLSRPRRPLSRGFSPAGYPTKPLVSYRTYR